MTAVTNSNFQQEVLASEKPVLIDFWAEWCMPCQRMAPEFAALAEEHPDVKFVKVNVDEAQELAISFGVDAIPAFVLVEGGESVAKAVGMMPKEKLAEFLEENK